MVASEAIRPTSPLPTEQQFPSSSISNIGQQFVIRQKKKKKSTPSVFDTRQRDGTPTITPFELIVKWFLRPFTPVSLLSLTKVRGPIIHEQLLSRRVAAFSYPAWAC
jgi:hypothetical protein